MLLPYVLFVFCMSELISSFRGFGVGAQVFALRMLFLCVILHIMSSGKSLQYDVCENYVGSVYVVVYGGLSESGLCVFCKLYPVCFLVVGKCPSVLLLSVVMSYVNCGNNG